MYTCIFVFIALEDLPSFTTHCYLFVIANTSFYVCTQVDCLFGCIRCLYMYTASVDMPSSLPAATCIVNVCMYACTCIHMKIYATYIYVHIHIYICIYLNICRHDVYIHECIHECIHVHKYTNIYMHLYQHTHKNTRTHK